VKPVGSGAAAGIKGIRARLYYDAGVDTVEKLAGWEPEALRVMRPVRRAKRLRGIPPLPKESQLDGGDARRLPKSWRSRPRLTAAQQGLGEEGCRPLNAKTAKI